MNRLTPRSKNMPGWILAGMLAVLLLACGHMKTAESTAPDFDGAVFISRWTQSETVQLENGEYREPAAPGSATQIVVRLSDDIVLGTLNGGDIAAVILVTDPGGSGTFYDLALLVKEAGVWVNTDLTTLGDRVKILSLAMEENMIVVDLTTHGPSDPMCCPTLQKKLRYSIDADRLVQAAPREPESKDDRLIGFEWKWQQTLYGDGSKSAPPKPENYTLLLAQDGRISARIDCNRGGGTYTLEDSRISIDITHSTMAACPPESLDQAFLKDLSAAAIYFIKDGALYLDLKYDTGTMLFRK